MTPHFMQERLSGVSTTTVVKPILLQLCHSRMRCQILFSWGSITRIYSSYNGLSLCPINPHGALIWSHRNSAHAFPLNSRDSSLPRISALRCLSSCYHCLVNPNNQLYHSEQIRLVLGATRMGDLPCDERQEYGVCSK